jgi:hypothetical protein
MNVFISYAKEDEDQANRLYHELLAIPGVTPWLDSKNLLPGARWKLVIMEALKTCDLFVLLLSNHSVSKNGFVQKEIFEALEKLKNFPPDRIFIVPARLDDCHPKHPELQELQWVDLFPDWNVGFVLIMKTIHQLMGKPFKIPSVKDDVVMETITSPVTFERRMRARGEMRGVDAMELALQDKQFKACDLAGANFVRSLFRNCDFKAANLQDVNFEGAIFEDCRFAGADLWGVNFWGANIAGIRDLPKARLKHTNFFLNICLEVQEEFIARHPDTVHLGDYGAFLRYFSEDLGMDNDAMGRTFVWINHRYFKLMFDKSRDSQFLRRTTSDLFEAE